MEPRLDIPTPSEELLSRYNVSGLRYISYPTAPCLRARGTPALGQERELLLSRLSP